jgi:DNA-binding transcriptional LysR family regulator
MQNGGSTGTETKSQAQMLTFANLRIFEALARLASFSRAAEELRVSQPYVSAQIAALEARAGVQLFRRVGRRAHLTEAGRMLQDYAVRILAEFEKAETSLSAIRGVVAGPLSIAATATPAASILPASLERFLAAYPAVTVSMRIFGSPDVERAVIEGRCDLGVLVSKPETSGLTAESVGTDELVVVVSPAHPYGGRSQITAEELAHERLLVREPSSGTRRFIESQFSSDRSQTPVRA